MLIKKNMLKALVFLTGLKKISLYILRLHWIFLISLQVLMLVKKLKQIVYSPFGYILEIKNESIYLGNLDIFFINQLLSNWCIFLKSSILVLKKKVKKWTVLRSVFVHATSKETIVLPKWKIRICFQTKAKNFFIDNFFIYKMTKSLAKRSTNFIRLRISNCSYYEKKSNSIRLS